MPGMASLRGDGRAFEWRVGTGHWRWLLLGSLGVVASACWGKAEDDNSAVVSLPGRDVSSARARTVSVARFPEEEVIRRSYALGSILCVIGASRVPIGRFSLADERRVRVASYNTT